VSTDFINAGLKRGKILYGIHPCYDHLNDRGYIVVERSGNDHIVYGVDKVGTQYISRRLFSTTNRPCKITKREKSIIFLGYGGGFHCMTCRYYDLRRGIANSKYSIEVPLLRNNESLGSLERVVRQFPMYMVITRIEEKDKAFTLYSIKRNKKKYVSFVISTVISKESQGSRVNYITKSERELGMYRYRNTLLHDAIFITASGDAIVCIDRCIFLFTKRSNYKQRLVIARTIQSTAGRTVVFDSKKQMLLVVGKKITKSRNYYVINYISVPKYVPLYWHFTKAYQSTIIYNGKNIAAGKNGILVTYWKGSKSMVILENKIR
jgi:hypothetical protein